MAQHLPNPELPAPKVDDRDCAASPGPAAATSEADQTGTEPPHVREAVLAIARLIGRQAAHEFLARDE